MLALLTWENKNVRKTHLILPGLAALAACGSGDPGMLPGDSSDTTPFSEITEADVLRLTGTEPFWGATIDGNTLKYSTPENIDGITIAVTRFAGRGGVSFSGTLEGEQMDVMITPGACSDGMSDREYPYNATLRIGDEQRSGCAWREGMDELGEP